MSESRTTRNYEEIKNWVEERDGYPATVIATKGDVGAGLLRIDFPDYSGAESLERTSWETFFDKFDSENIEFLYQNQTADGQPSRFCKFVRAKSSAER